MVKCFFVLSPNIPNFRQLVRNSFGLRRGTFMQFNTASSCKLPLNFKFKIDMETTYANARTSLLLYFSLFSIKMGNWILETFNDHTYLEASRRYQVNQLDLRIDYVETNGITRKMLQQILRHFKSSVEQSSFVLLVTLLLFSPSLQDEHKNWFIW